jgi:hypothetical protein
MALSLKQKFASLAIRLSHKARFQLSSLETSDPQLVTQTIHLLGLFEGANSGISYVTIVGPGQDQTIKESGNFDQPFDLQPGTFKFYISNFTDGTFTVNITGTFQSVSPTMPYKFPSNYDVITLVV